MNAEDKKIKIFVVSLGCDKNRVDTEEMLGNLWGYIIASRPEEADLIIVNTCAFIEKAREEAVDTILEMASYGKKLVVTGCLAEKYSEELIKEIPEIDGLMGTDDYSAAREIVDRVLAGEKCNFVGKGKALYGGERLITTPVHYAYLRIADGCGNHCTFCTIPSIRGEYRSVPADILIKEAENLAGEGVKELILVAQDTTRYGSDFKDGTNLTSLLKELSLIDGIEWIRLLYCYPDGMTDELIEEIVNNSKIVKYADIPLQHVSDSVLKRMGRKNSSSEIKSLITRLKAEGISVRTTFMVGFPGESEEEFSELTEFVREYKLDNVGIFMYSAEEDTPSFKIPGHLSERIKKQRYKILAAEQYEVINQNNAAYIGRTVTVRYEDMDFKKRLFKGRMPEQTPDADGCVYFKSEFPLNVGELYSVKIEKFKGYDLYGKTEERFSE